MLLQHIHSSSYLSQPSIATEVLRHYCCFNSKTKYYPSCNIVLNILKQYQHSRGCKVGELQQLDASGARVLRFSSTLNDFIFSKQHF